MTETTRKRLELCPVPGMPWRTTQAAGSEVIAFPAGRGSGRQTRMTGTWDDGEEPAHLPRERRGIWDSDERTVLINNKYQLIICFN